MKRTAVILMLVILGFGTLAPIVRVDAATPTRHGFCKSCGEEEPTPTLVSAPVVHFWFFFDSGCYTCMQVYNRILPRILANYPAEQVAMNVWDVSQFGVAVPRALEQRYGVVKPDATEIFIGEYALLGSQEIEARLPRLIDHYLAQGGIALTQVNASAQPSATRTPTRAPSPTPIASSPKAVVHAVMFWGEYCSYCHYVIENMLPPLQKKYGAQLDIQLFELSQSENMRLFEAAMEVLRVPPSDWAVPFMIVGDQTMIGGDEISQQLPRLIEKHLAAGGIGLPKIPGLEKRVAPPIPTIAPTFAPTPAVRVIVNPTSAPPTAAPSPTVVALAPAKPVARAVMFWMKGCTHCEEVSARVLPPLQQKYGAQFEIRLIEVVTAQDVEQLYQLAASFGFSKEQTGVPLLIIGNQALVGANQIPAELPRLIETHLAAGGVDFPSLGGASARAATPASRAVCPPTTADCGPEAPIQKILRQDPVGFALALIVLLGMLGALARVGADALARHARVAPAWETWVVPLLILLGIGVAGYLAYVEVLEVSAICGPVGNCNTVQQSPYARLFGILPIGVLGVLGYLAILGAWLVGQIGRGELAVWGKRAAFAFAIFGVLFSLYLTLLEPFVIGAVCAWCLSSAILMTALMLILSRDLR
ncbi:MAG: vitamin K epoxide reductase family protein [Chloroflexi bacterium]|nr:vitamin K epoxide reductase family protein [Chloroflexota bacterium]